MFPHMSFLKKVWVSVVPLAVSIFILGLIIIILTTSSFVLSNLDSRLSNSYGDLSKQIRDFDITNLVIITTREEFLIAHKSVNLATTLVREGLFVEVVPGRTAKEAYIKYIALKVALGLENVNAMEDKNLKERVKDIKNINDYWRLVEDSNNIVDTSYGKSQEIDSKINFLIKNQSVIKEKQNHIEFWQILIFILATTLTFLSSILGFRLVLLERAKV